MGDTEDQKPDKGRRAFAHAAVLLSGTGALAAVAYPVFRFLQPLKAAPTPEATPTEVCSDAEIAPGQARYAQLGSTPIILVRRHDSSLKAWSALCTHLGCTLSFRPERDELSCACHGAAFDAATGVRKSGPAPSPLARIQVEILHGRIVLWA